MQYADPNTSAPAPATPRRLCSECADLVHHHDKIKLLATTHGNVKKVCGAARKTRVRQRKPFRMAEWRCMLGTLMGELKSEVDLLRLWPNGRRRRGMGLGGCGGGGGVARNPGYTVGSETEGRKLESTSSFRPRGLLRMPENSS